GPAAAHEVVDDEDLGDVLVQQLIDDRRSDETTTTGHHDPRSGELGHDRPASSTATFAPPERRLQSEASRICSTRSPDTPSVGGAASPRTAEAIASMTPASASASGSAGDVTSPMRYDTRLRCTCSASE